MTSDVIENSFSNRVLFLLFLMIVSTIPWLHGAELPWEIFLFSALTIGILSAYITFVKLDVTQELASIKAPIYCLLAWLVYNCSYLIPLPNEMVFWLSPNLVSGVNSPSSATRLLTVSKSLTLIEVARIACVISVFILSYLIAKHKSRQLIILKVMFYSSAIMALYSQLNHYTNGQFELVEAIPPWNADWATTVRGTFSYKNQYAIYTAMTIFIGLGVLTSGLPKQQKEISFSSFVQNVLMEKQVVSLVLLIVMFVSLVGSDSRGGVLMFTVTCLIFTGRYFLRSERTNWSKKQALGGIGVICLLISIFAFSKSFERYESVGLNDHGRNLLHITATNVISDYPILGSGSGTYSVIQHVYKSTELGNSDMSKRAHSDYLELLSTQGVIGFLLFTIPLILLLRKVVKPVPDENIILMVGCQAAILCLLLHSLIDFNFSSLVFGVYFFVLLALLLRMAEANTLSRESSAN